MLDPWKIVGTSPCESILLTKVNWLRIGSTWAPCRHPGEGPILYKKITSTLSFYFDGSWYMGLHMWDMYFINV